MLFYFHHLYVIIRCSSLQVTAFLKNGILRKVYVRVCVCVSGGGRVVVMVQNTDEDFQTTSQLITRQPCFCQQDGAVYLLTTFFNIYVELYTLSFL